MKTKHTPGPWEVRIHDKGLYFSEVEIWNENYGLIARMSDNTSIWNFDKNEKAAKEALDKTIADANIMAAAPDLLMWANDLVSRLELMVGNGLILGADCCDTVHMLNQAIQKATP